MLILVGAQEGSVLRGPSGFAPQPRQVHVRNSRRCACGPRGKDDPTTRASPLGQLPARRRPPGPAVFLWHWRGAARPPRRFSPLRPRYRDHVIAREGFLRPPPPILPPLFGLAGPARRAGGPARPTSHSAPNASSRRLLDDPPAHVGSKKGGPAEPRSPPGVPPQRSLPRARALAAWRSPHREPRSLALGRCRAPPRDCAVIKGQRPARSAEARACSAGLTRTRDNREAGLVRQPGTSCQT